MRGLGFYLCVVVVNPEIILIAFYIRRKKEGEGGRSTGQCCRHGLCTDTVRVSIWSVWSTRGASECDKLAK